MIAVLNMLLICALLAGAELSALSGDGDALATVDPIGERPHKFPRPSPDRDIFGDFAPSGPEQAAETQPQEPPAGTASGQERV